MVRPRSQRATAALVVAATACWVAGCGAPTPASTPGPVTSAPKPVSSTSTSVPTSAATPAAPSSASAGPSTPSGATPGRPAPTGCAARAGTLSLDEQVGQLLMVGVGSTGVGAAAEEVLADTGAGSAILLGNSRAGRAAARKVVAQVRRAADEPKRVRMLVAVDQEGGVVQRLKGEGFSTMPSALVQAEQSDQALRADAARWGRQLAAADIDANLAPVADVVPASMTGLNAPVGQLRRGYGSAPKKVAAKVAAFTAGMGEADLATAVKHFPGLGRVRGNTDFSTHVVDSTTTRRDRALAGFDAAIKAGVSMVMVSSAYYSKIDRKDRAAFSSVVITGMLRGDRKFTGVVISDDLSAAAMRDLGPGQRAVRFVSAGGDLAIVGDPAQARAMAAALKAKAKGDRTFRARVEQSAARVLAMKARRGLADC